MIFGEPCVLEPDGTLSIESIIEPTLRTEISKWDAKAQRQPRIASSGDPRGVATAGPEPARVDPIDLDARSSGCDLAPQKRWGTSDIRQRGVWCGSDSKGRGFACRWAFEASLSAATVLK